MIPGVYNRKRDKSFFFWSQEWRGELIPPDSPFNTRVSSPGERTGDFSDLCPNVLTGSERAAQSIHKWRTLYLIIKYR